LKEKLILYKKIFAIYRHFGVVLIIIVFHVPGVSKLSEKLFI